MYDVTALGELLIDFTPSDHSDKGNILFETNPGGAPANVLVALSKLDKKTAFIGKVGNDQFGHFLRSVLQEHNIDTSNLLFSDHVNTTLAFVHLDENGDRSFSFYRNPGADIMLDRDEINEELIKQSRIFHFGSLSLTNDPAATATFTALLYAKKHKKIISYDPNLRIPLWESLDDAKEMMLKGLEYADIVKLSEEELEFLTGYSDVVKGTEVLHAQYDTSLIFVTLGSKGCFYRSKKDHGSKEGFRVKAIDTTGAGDAFLGGVLYKLLETNKPLHELTTPDLVGIVTFANALGALATEEKGGIPSMPTMEQVERLLNKE
ncbi:fructokinase [Anoxybacillus voinovskiensis]|uniref:Fructokinase n=1 Tax=Anoxybacteroides voinovskiense TaxID=230470 RepID=A0A840DVF1_9BACL|nr:PfkB family carbohydrate kinase [Anoxybacillus voinovskiensis]MBB4073056.1 fructokinase [Anoxybacillus voinovskiensis]GGJ59825.1 fructokinase [Anoxybacillus voinovskiensis]